MQAVSVTKEVYWKVRQVSKDFLESKKPGEGILSETFEIPIGDVSTKWFMQLFPNGYNEQYKSNVSLYLHSQSAEEEDCVDFKVTFQLGVSKNNKWINNHVIPYGERSKEYMKEDGHGFSKFLPHADLFNEKKGLVVNGELTVFAELKLEIEVETEKPQLEIPRSATMIADVMADFKKMFKNESLSDFQLKTSDNRVLKAHKVILAARSPVFYAMLTTDLKEQHKGTADVPDFDPKVMKEVLRFVYYNEVENLEEVAPKLIYAAEKYQLKELKVICLQQMLSSLELKNAVKFLKVAYEVSGANELFEKCVEMIKNNYSEVFANPTWKDLPNELMCKLMQGFCQRCNRMDI